MPVALKNPHIPAESNTHSKPTGQLYHDEVGPCIGFVRIQRPAIKAGPLGVAPAKFRTAVTEDIGPVSLPCRMPFAQRARALKKAVIQHLPHAWLSKIDRAVKAAQSGAMPYKKPIIEGEVYAHWLTKYAGASGADMSDGAIRFRATEIAQRGHAARFAERGESPSAYSRLREFVERFGGTTPAPGKYTIEGLAKRVACPKWWRRQLRGLACRQFETGSIELGMVGAKAGQWYCTDKAVMRRMEQNRANEAAMRAVKIESSTGKSMTIWDAAQRTVSNKVIRRGELMTRIKGCELMAEKCGLAGLFTTHTLPSRFHRAMKYGGMNPKWDGSTPADGQAWLRLQWSRLRARLDHIGIRIMGFRVVEPHHDGTPHWHMLIWCAPGHVEQLKLAIWLAWLPVDDTGDWREPGALAQRTNVKAMLPGLASGYIAKYIAKNIDDRAIESHSDDGEVPGMTIGPDLLGDVEVKPCSRVEAWASTWKIRQFQAIGQPPVTVWRGLRTVTQQAAAAGSDDLIRAWLACHRRGEEKADWHAYMVAQGGAMLARADYRFCTHTIDKSKKGRYEVVLEKWACGIRDRREPDAFAVTPTKRERWGAEGFAARSASPPWTRLNNCRRHNAKSVGEVSAHVRKMAESGILDSENGLRGYESEQAVIKRPWLEYENPW